MKADLSERSKILFIIFVSLGIYYPSIFGEENSVDDIRMITQIMNTTNIDWKNIFLPESSLYYYRPVLWLSYVIDGLLFVGYYYRLGQYYLAINDRRNAIESFKESVRLSPDQYFSEPARRLIKRLEERS